jgi:8-oxo-dGTP pyrophosphatase MutT (NUDIX family)
MDIFPLLDELQTIARNGLAFAMDPYDRERYQRLLELVSLYYGQVVNLPPDEIEKRFTSELGYITPKVGADAAIFDDLGKILLMLRSDNDKWCLPCGWVEPGESTLETVVRETWEECGLRVKVIRLVDVINRQPGIISGPHSAISVVYLCEVISGSLTLSHEGKDLRYWEIDEVLAWHMLHKNYADAAQKAWLIYQLHNHD